MQAKGLEAYMQMPYRTFVMSDTCDRKICFVAYHPELEGCMAQGITWEEAVFNLKSARAEYIALRLELGWPVPIPQLQINLPQRPMANPQDNNTHVYLGFNRNATPGLVMA